jgi:cyclic pyranopterin phosphate synthase
MHRIIKRFFSSSKEPLTKFLYNHPVPPNALTSKLTHLPILQDNHKRFHNYLRISLTEHCNFRCTYCTVSTQVDFTPKEQLLTEDEFLRLAKLFVKAGVTKIRLSGGEPTVYKGLGKFIHEIGNMEQVKTLAITTNGYIIHRKLAEYQQNGLNAINISLDTFKEEKFQKISKMPGLKNVFKSIDRALELGFSPVKVNCVVMRGENDDELLDFVEFVRDKDVNVRFIEFFAIGANQWERNKSVSFKEMTERIEAKYGKLIRCNDHFSDTAKNFTLDGFKGKVSFITSVTTPFCGTCNRIRLLSTGNFRRCLHDNNMFDLRMAIQKGYSDDVILEAISQHLKGKHRAHAGMEIIKNMPSLNMMAIGG